MQPTKRFWQSKNIFFIILGLFIISLIMPFTESEPGILQLIGIDNSTALSSMILYGVPVSLFILTVLSGISAFNLKADYKKILLLSIMLNLILLGTVAFGMLMVLIAVLTHAPGANILGWLYGFLIILVAGPVSIISLPVTLFGYITYRKSGQHTKKTNIFYVAMCLISLVGFCMFFVPIAMVFSQDLIYEYQSANNKDVKDSNKPKTFDEWIAQNKDSYSELKKKSIETCDIQRVVIYNKTVGSTSGKYLHVITYTMRYVTSTLPFGTEQSSYWTIPESYSVQLKNDLDVVKCAKSAQWLDQSQ